MAPAPGQRAKPLAVLTGHQDGADGVCSTHRQGERGSGEDGRTDGRTDAHLQRKRRWEARPECKPASRTTCALALSPPGRTDRQTDSSSPGLVQSPKQSAAARHIPANPGPALVPAAEATESPASPCVPFRSTAATMRGSGRPQPAPTSLFSGKAPSALPTDPGFGKSPLRSRLPEPPLCRRDGRRLRRDAPGAQYQGSARCCWL